MTGSEARNAAVGDTADMVARMRKVMPSSWFPVGAASPADSMTPVLDGLLAGLGAAWAYCYVLTRFVVQQARIRTASSSFLDMICNDYFGGMLKRNLFEADESFRSRILSNLLMSRATRADLIGIVTSLVGGAPTIFEPFRSADTGGYGGVSNPGAGGGAGYGVSGLALGSSSMPFQYLVGLVLAGMRTRRESAASFIDENGKMQIAPRHALRTAYVSGVATGPLVEPRGFNLLKDSMGWGGCTQAAEGAVARWQVDPFNADALWPTQPLLSITVQASGTVLGPAMKATADGPVTASVWIFLPIDHQLQALDLVCDAGDLLVSPRSPVNLRIVGQWQRVSVARAAGSGTGIDILMLLLGASAGAMNLPVLTQCWQLEPGLSASSYIPSSRQIGVREPDDLITSPFAAVTQVDLDSINQVIARAIPAASIAWTTIAG